MKALIFLFFALTVAEEECGIKGHGLPRIIEGHDTKPHEYPWMALIVLKEKETVGCGASIISNQWLATAAHCIPYLLNGTLWLGLHNFRKKNGKFSPDPFAFEVEYEKWIRHPKYWTPKPSTNDIALIKLRQPLDFKQEHKQLRPICLPNATMSLDVLNGMKCIVTGWGFTKWEERGHEMPEDDFPLQQMAVPIVSAEDCLKRFPILYDKETEICAGDASGGPGVCGGDSGGPLQCQLEDGKWYLIGIVSYGKPCAQGFPDVYARVSRLVDWVHQTIKENKTKLEKLK